MENQRAKTFEALESFIRSQRTLLARTQTDITRLQQLRSHAVSQPAQFMKNFDQELAENTFRLSDQCDSQINHSPNLDWSVYDAHDPKALQNLTLNAQQKYEQRNKPFRHQQSELSELQKLVKEARRVIVDPILTIFESVSEDEIEEKLSLEEGRRGREKEGTDQLKKRTLHTRGGLRLPTQVLVRTDAEDESVDVDITLEDLSEPSTRIDSTHLSSIPVIPSSSTSTPQSLWSPKVQRSRQPSHKAQAQSDKIKKTLHPAKRKATVSSQSIENEVSQKLAPDTSKPRGSDKPKPETYKQAWSVSEQHLLEQLLDQIPEGEKNRWQKISRAMNGRRTPRQVASRVQKYFEKLKRFGLGEGLKS